MEILGRAGKFLDLLIQFGNIKLRARLLGKICPVVQVVKKMLIGRRTAC